MTFEFVNGTDSMDDKPKSGVGDNDIKSIIIDISGVDSPEKLVDAMYEQGMPQLKNLDHNLYLAKNDANPGEIIIYDNRNRDLQRDYGSYFQAPGPKISDGILDNVVLVQRKVMVNRLIIHHTDKASMNIKIDIPQTTMDHIFQFVPDPNSLRKYTVTDAKMRQELLGWDEPKPAQEGILDRGMKYLTDANTLVGAQISRLEKADSNIITANENETNAESTIRDADMAKEMTNYAKDNIISQTAQAMLAQANQNSSSVLSLLQ